MGTTLQKISENKPLTAKTKKRERNFSEKHRSTLLPGKTQLKFENKSMPLPDQTEQNSENPPLTAKTKNRKWEVRTTARNMYTTFIHKRFDYSIITPFKYG